MAPEISDQFSLVNPCFCVNCESARGKLSNYPTGLGQLVIIPIIFNCIL